MDEVIGLVLVVVAALCGPAALVVSLVALKRMREMQSEMQMMWVLPPTERRASVRPRLTNISPVATEAGPAAPVQAAPTTEAKVPAQPVSVPPVPLSVPAESAGGGSSSSQTSARLVISDVPARPRRESLALEQRIATRWALIAGVITIVFAVGFFLKYAYESGWIGPLGRVMIAGFGGLLALTIGELTRRRGYDFVAKGITALGFAILYATVFAAHRWYGLLGSAPAYVLAVAITTVAMLYAVVLDEVIVAVLSLVGGYITPVVLSRGENLPTLLFSYVLILSAGAVLCASWRKWSIVSILAFLGTYGLYTGWFERFCRPAMERGSTPQLGVALFWLSVFFLIYLLVPLVHTLVRRVRSQVQDMLLVLADGVVVFYYLATMLMDRHENWLALCSLLMGATYLGLMALVFLRCRADVDLLNTLLVVGLSFASLAVPLYYEVHAAAAVWALEAVGLAAVGLRYRNTLVQIAAGAVAALALGNLVYHLPMHTDPFRLFLNRTFGTWCLVAAAVLVGHVLYRLDKHADVKVRQMATQVLYIAGLLVLMAAIGMELWCAPGRKGEAFFEKQMVLVFALFLVLFAAGPLPPRGPLCPPVAAVIGAIGPVFLAVAYSQFHRAAFPMFTNAGLIRALALVAALFTAAWLLHRGGPRLEEELAASMVLALAGVLLLWIVLTEEIWFHYRLQELANWRLLAHMYISVMWAVYASVLMVIGFWQRVRPLRYIALGIFVLLLAKIFLIDTRTLDASYRIAGFLATGLALVGVSYLYQYLKKMGFFEAVR